MALLLFIFPEERWLEGGIGVSLKVNQRVLFCLEFDAINIKKVSLIFGR
jgi:hypothetical protein